MRYVAVFASACLALLPHPLRAAPAVHEAAEAQALSLAQQAIALRSVQGPQNKTPEVAALYRDALVKAGFKPGDIAITPVDDTAYLIATWPGSDAALKPLVISGHMDVVEAKPADWKRDPFKPVVEDGYLFGRGATDMKLDGTIAIASLAELRREGFVPRRTIIIEFSGDEETAMRTSEMVAEKLKGAELVLNMDGTEGVLDEKTGAPLYYMWTGAEKTYADFGMTVTNPGGHSSEPRKVNAIDELAAALLRIQAHRFTPELNPLTKAYFEQAAAYADPQLARAMRAFARNPRDEQAIRTLSSDFAMIGKIGTTCVVTEINGGHALNALPQHATANINCRIFPGHKREDIMNELVKAAADPAIEFRDNSAGSVATDASPMRPDLLAALDDGVHRVYPGMSIVPAMSSGASDSMWFRHLGVPAYGISPLFIKNSENFAHGLNERSPVASIRPAIDMLLPMIEDLSR